MNRLVVLLFLAALSLPRAGLSMPVTPGEAPVAMQIKRVLLVSDSPAVLLVDRTERKFVLVFIDFFMANAIRMGMEEPALERPLTHDLIGIFLRRMGAKLKRIDITDLKNNTYYALITLEVNGKSQQFDARPSDAMAIAVRNDTPIFVNPKLLKSIDEELKPTPPGESEIPPKGDSPPKASA